MRNILLPAWNSKAKVFPTAPSRCTKNRMHANPTNLSAPQTVLSRFAYPPTMIHWYPDLYARRSFEMKQLLQKGRVLFFQRFTVFGVVNDSRVSNASCWISHLLHCYRKSECMRWTGSGLYRKEKSNERCCSQRAEYFLLVQLHISIIMIVNVYGSLVHPWLSGLLDPNRGGSSFT